MVWFLLVVVVAIIIIALLPTKKTPNTSPTTGWEHDYDPDWWRQFDYTENHNCYDYAFGNVRFDDRVRSQPGTLDGDERMPTDIQYTCDNVTDALIDDHKNIRNVDFSTQCGPHEYKIALMAAGGSPPYEDTSDYHFMRQDSNGLWSHKPGKNQPTNKDGSGDLIYSPENSDRHFGNYNYDEMCGYWCVRIDDNSNFS